MAVSCYPPSLPSSAIKVWDFQAALDPRTPADAICLRTLVVSFELKVIQLLSVNSQI